MYNNSIQTHKPEKNVWQIWLDGQVNEVRVKSGILGGVSSILVNGMSIPKKSGIAASIPGSVIEHPFMLGRYPATIRQKVGLWQTTYDVVVNGYSIENQAMALPITLMPGWAWIFVVACLAVPVVTLGGAIPAILGLFGASGVGWSARHESMNVGTRVALCVGITVLAWVGLLILLLITGTLRR
jgi:hypothetical protein